MNAQRAPYWLLACTYPPSFRPRRSASWACRSGRRPWGRWAASQPAWHASPAATCSTGQRALHATGLCSFFLPGRGHCCYHCWQPHALPPHSQLCTLASPCIMPAGLQLTMDGWLAHMPGKAGCYTLGVSLPAAPFSVTTTVHACAAVVAHAALPCWFSLLIPMLSHTHAAVQPCNPPVNASANPNPMQVPFNPSCSRAPFWSWDSTSAAWTCRPQQHRRWGRCWRTERRRRQRQ